MKKVIELTIEGKVEEIVLRHVRRKDVKGVWNNFNQVVDEKRYLPVFFPVKSEFEMNGWFEKLKKDGEFCIVADYGKLKKPDNILGQCEISNVEWEASEHVGNLGVIIKKGFRNLGLGRELIDVAIREAARKHHKEKIVLSCFHTNERALHLYESVGFKQVGVRRKQFLMDGAYYDEVMMDLWIEDYLDK